MKLALVGSRSFAATVFDMLRQLDGVHLTSIVAPAADDRLALAAKAPASRGNGHWRRWDWRCSAAWGAMCATKATYRPPRRTCASPPRRH
jgi:hypothetical protein